MLEGRQDLPRLRFRSPKGVAWAGMPGPGMPPQPLCCVNVADINSWGALNCERLHSMQTLSGHEKGRPVRSGCC